jgi:phosphate transport system protein
VRDDKKIDALEAEVEQLTVQTIALRAPMADDLREMIAALKIVSVVERIGDYAKNIAKRVALMDQTRSIEAIPVLMSMSNIVVELVHDALDSFAARDAELAVRVTARDKNVDDFYNSIFRTLVTFMMENPRYISESAHLLFVAKNLERMGDHATNIAEMVYYVVTGERMEERERGEQPEDGAAEKEQG